MTAPINVGSVSVEVAADASKIAKKLREEFQHGLKDLKFDKALKDAVGDKPINVPVSPEVDTKDIPEKIKKTRVPKVPVEVDPLLQAFQQEVRRQVNALARQGVKLPVGADTDRFQAELSAQLKSIAARSKATVPTEPGGQAEYRQKLQADIARASAQLKARIATEPADRAGYEAKLKAQVASAAGRVKQTVKVDVDKRGIASIGSTLNPIRGIPQLLSGAFQNLARSMQQSGNAAVQMGGNILGALSTAGGPIGAVVVGITAVTAGLAAVGVAATVAIPAVNALAGALAALPGLAAGIGAGVGTLALGFRGISEAFKPKTGGGGGGGAKSDPAARARAIAGAERGVESARRGITAATRGVQSAERGYRDAVEALGLTQARAAKSQEAVNRARKEAREDIDDLGRALRGAALDEESAALAVTDALRELNAVKLTGNIPDIQRADIAYRQAQLTLENSRDTVGDLAEEQAESAEKGVEGSDKVQSALDDQAESLRAVKSAQQAVADSQTGILAANEALQSSYDGLASAQDALASAQAKAAAGGGGGGALKEVIKLAPNAQKFVDAIKALKPAFEGLRLDVQQRLFAGLDKTVTNLGNAWIPRLKTTLGSYADTFNGFFKTLGANISTPEFMTRIQVAAEGARKGLDAILKAVSGPLVTAFGQLAEKSAPFLEKLGTIIAGLVTDFARWIDSANQSGALQDFFTSAGEALSDIATTGKLVVKIIGQVFAALFQSGQGQGKSAIDSFNDGLQKVSDWLAKPENQAKIRAFVDDLIELSQRFAQTVRDVNAFLTPSGQDAAANSLGAVIGKALVAGVVAGIQEAVLFNLQTLQGVAQFIVDKFKEWFGISSPSTVFATIGSQLMDGLAKGVRDRLATLRASILSARNTVVTAASTAGTWLLNAGRSVVGGLINGVVGWYRNASIAVGNLRVSVINAVLNAGSWLINAGRAVISGLINGIYSAIGSLGGALNYVTNFIRDNKGPIEKDRKLLIPAGVAIMDGLISGIGSRRNALGSELAAVTSQVQSQSALLSAPELGGSFDAAVSRSLAMSSQQKVLAAWAPNASGDKLLDALRSLITFDYNGDPVAALSPRR